LSCLLLLIGSASGSIFLSFSGRLSALRFGADDIFSSLSSAYTKPNSLGVEFVQANFTIQAGLEDRVISFLVLDFD
jgi:hypothetical protein